MTVPDPIRCVPADECRLGGGDIVISLTPEQVTAIGLRDISDLADWFHTALQALAALRSDDVPQPSWHAAIKDIDLWLLPRLKGIRDAVIQAHADSGGSLSELALAMDVSKSTAQYRRETVTKSGPGLWGAWARSGGSQR